jgi:ABC-type glycerol-3-phosphate transport system substrate-binding protein
MSILAWAQMAQVLQINPKINYGFFNLPAVQASDTVVSAAMSQVAVAFGSTGHPKEAKMFITYLSQGKGAEAFAASGATGGYVQGLSESDIRTGKAPAFASAQQPALKAGKLILSLHNFPNPTLLTGSSGVAGAITGLMSGQSTVDSALKAFDYLWDHPSATSAS